MNRETLPASWYRGERVFEAERASVFGRTWQLVARASELARTGDYVASTIAGWPVVVVLGGDGRLRGFHDVCLHRGGPLTREANGNCRGSLVCGYHGWTYALDGSLLRARDFGEDMTGRGLALHPIRVDTWRGLVFVNLDQEATPLAEALGGFDAACRDLPLGDFAFDGEQVHEIRCNWKTYADNYLEGYHIPVVHPELDEAIDSRRYEVAVHDDGRWCRHTAPARGDRELDATSGVWLWRYPNLALNVYPDGMNVERILPDGPDRTRIVYWYFFAPGASSSDASRKVSAQLMDEDRAICEAVQRNLDAGVYDRGPLSPRHEQGVAAFQRWLRDAVEGELA